MKVISLVCQKGGSAKSTAAINLAVEATSRGLEVALIDLDPQVSACNWADVRVQDGERPPTVVATPVPHLGRALKVAEEAGADLVIVDTAGRTNDAALAAVRAADLVLVPIQASKADLDTLAATLDVIKTGGNKPTRVILSRVRAVGSRRADAAEWITSQGVEVCPVSLGDRIIYQDSYARGLSVTEAEPSGAAANEVRQIYAYVAKILSLSTKGASNVRKVSRKDAKAASPVSVG
jgi:chromosome partitioning protein